MRNILTTCTSVFLALALLVPQGAQAARIFTLGMEWQEPSAGYEYDSISESAPTISTSVVHGGAASGRINGILNNEGEGYIRSLSTARNTFYMRGYIYIDNMISAADTATGLWAISAYGGSGLVAGVKIENDAGTLDLRPYYNDGGGELSDTASLSFDTWYRIEMFADTTGAGSTDTFTVRIDGVQVASATNLNMTITDPTEFETYFFNATGATDNTTDVYFDDIALNDTAGSDQSSWPGEGKIVVLVPNAAGDNNCTSGDYTMVNEIPPSDTVTDATTVCRLNTSGDIADFNVTDSSTAGIDSYDTITLVYPVARMREVITTGAPSGYSMRVKSASGGTATTTPGYDASNATAVRTNPNGNGVGADFLNIFAVYADPTTSTAWTPTGTNSIDNMQIGISSTDSDPDFYIVTYAAMVEYVDGSPPVVVDNALIRLLGNFRMNGNLRLLGL